LTNKENKKKALIFYYGQNMKPVLKQGLAQKRVYKANFMKRQYFKDIMT
jgi:hypothetical protein